MSHGKQLWHEHDVPKYYALSGYADKRQQNKALFGYLWNKRFFKVTNKGTLLCYWNKDRDCGKSRPNQVMELRHCTKVRRSGRQSKELTVTFQRQDGTHKHVTLKLRNREVRDFWFVALYYLATHQNSKPVVVQQHGEFVMGEWYVSQYLWTDKERCNMPAVHFSDMRLATAYVNKHGVKGQTLCLELEDANEQALNAAAPLVRHARGVELNLWHNKHVTKHSFKKILDNMEHTDDLRVLRINLRHVHQVDHSWLEEIGKTLRDCHSLDDFQLWVWGCERVDDNAMLHVVEGLESVHDLKMVKVYAVQTHVGKTTWARLHALSTKHHGLRLRLLGNQHDEMDHIEEAKLSANIV